MAEATDGIQVSSVQKAFTAKAVKFLGISVSVRREQVVKALDGVSMRIEPGEAVGIIGPNGAGKTTLMGCLLGFIKPDKGEITIDGRPPNSLQVRKKIGYVPERLIFQRQIKIRELMELHYELALQPPANKQNKIDELLTTVGLDPVKWTLPVEKCSRGMLQRLAIAQALIGDPKYLFLDEPTSGIDPGGVIELTNLLKKIRSNGITFVLNSHQLDQVQNICDRVVFVQKGKLSTEEEIGSIGQTHALYIRFATPLDEQLQNELIQLSSDLELPLVESSSDKAQFAVQNDQDNLRLIKTLIDGGFPLVEVAPQHSKLERMFLSQKQDGEEVDG